MSDWGHRPQHEAPGRLLEARVRAHRAKIALVVQQTLHTISPKNYLPASYAHAA